MFTRKRTSSNNNIEANNTANNIGNNVSANVNNVVSTATTTSTHSHNNINVSNNNFTHARGNKKYKVVLLGESGVGKSSLAQRLIKNEWNPNLNSTVGASFFRYACNIGGTIIHCDIWDTAGQERYRSLASMYYRGAAAALVVYDITSRESFARAKQWVEELSTNSPDTILAIVGNKKDLEPTRTVSANEAQKFALETNLLYMEASAKEGMGVKEVFEALVKKLVENNNAINVRPGGVITREALPSSSPSTTSSAPQQSRNMCC